MAEVQAQRMGVVIPFPGPASRPLRPALRADQPRGEILLFTGVRYEWQPEPNPEPSKPALPHGSARSGRRRRRS
jgi:hypothetical protein